MRGFVKQALWGLTVLTAVTMGACTRARLPGAPGAPHRDRMGAPVRIVPADGRVQSLSLEAYVRGTVEAETWLSRTESPAIAERVFALQAIVSRTYAVTHRGRHGAEGADVCDTTHCQLYRDPAPQHRWAVQLDAAVERTAGQVITHDGLPIEALFHADCGGSTTSAELVWGGQARPYLSAADDRVCARGPAGQWSVTADRADLVRLLDADRRTRVGGQLDGVEVLSRDASGRAMLVALTGRLSPVVRAEELRTVLARGLGPRAFRSARFEVQRQGERFTFVGSGFGHGAGLCQAGALQRLRAGATPAEVIHHYYRGARLSTID